MSYHNKRITFRLTLKEAEQVHALLREDRYSFGKVSILIRRLLRAEYKRKQDAGDLPADRTVEDIFRGSTPIVGQRSVSDKAVAAGKALRSRSKPD